MSGFFPTSLPPIEPLSLSSLTLPDVYELTAQRLAEERIVSQLATKRSTSPPPPPLGTRVRPVTADEATIAAPPPAED
jgi:hypothetical protein